MSNAMTLERLQVVMEANTKKFNEEIKKVQNQVKSMTDSINGQVNKIKSAFGSIAKSVVGLFALSKVGKYIQNSVQSAMQVEASLQQVARTMGESTQSFLKWAETSALSFNMAQSDALKFGATYSNLVSSFLSDTNQITGATTDLLKASSVIASATGRTMDDVMERIRSGLLGNTEAIEDLGVNVNVALLETTEAFERLANGKSWSQLSFQTQQQIRLMAILEQTSSKFGNEVFQNTNSSLQQLIAILKDVALNLGNAFLPIANIVIPLLSKMAMWLRTVTSYFATFMQTLFGYSPKANAGITGTASSSTSAVNSLGNSLDSAGSSADKTKKKLQNLLGGFDEINTLNQNTDSGSGSGSSVGGSGGASGIDFGDLGSWNNYDLGEPDTSGIVRAAEKVKAVFKSIARFISENKEIILAIIGGLVAGIASYLALINFGSFSRMFYALRLNASMAIQGILSSFSTLVGGISWPAVAIAALVAGVVASFIYLWQTSDSFRQSLIEGWNNLVAIITPLVQSVVTIFKTVGDILWTILKPIVVIFADFFVTCVDNIVQAVMAFWNNIMAPFVQFFVDCVKKLVDGIAEIWQSWKPTIELIGNILIAIWNTTLKPFINWLGSVFINAFKNLGNYIKPILNDLKRAFNGLVDFITGILTGNWKKAWQGVVDIFGGIFGGIVNIAKTPINAVINLINKAIGNLNKISVDIPDWIPGIGGKKFGVNIPQIPKLARGGIVDSATIFMAGERGKEVVMPLENNTGWMSEVANRIASQLSQNQQPTHNDQPINLTLQIGSTTLGKIAIEGINKVQRQAGATLIKKI